tara:strand:+ start:3034 stop:3135 length:102 start_codon:yes stop_codon:yes gene_type:complete
MKKENISNKKIGLTLTKLFAIGFIDKKKRKNIK